MSQIDIIALNNLCETLWIVLKVNGKEPKDASELWDSINLELSLHEDEKRYIEFVLLDRVDRIGKFYYE